MKIIQWDGKPISTPGIYAGVPLSTYHSAGICDGPSISSSGLRTIFSKSAAHYWAKSPYNDDRDDEPEEREGLTLGRAAHHLFLGQPHFNREFVVRPEKVGGEPWHSNRTTCKEWLASQAKKNLTVLTPDVAKRVIRMAKALAAEPLVKNGILAGHVEHSMFWKDAKTGRWLKARPDAIPNADLDFADYKTTRSVDDLALSRTVNEYSYHMQGALIGMGVRAIIGKPMGSFNLVFQESTSPFCVATKAIKAERLAKGEEECRIAIDIFDRGLKTGTWLGPQGRQRDVSWVDIHPRAEEDRAFRASQLKRELESENKK